MDILKSMENLIPIENENRDIGYRVPAVSLFLDKINTVSPFDDRYKNK